MSRGRPIAMVFVGLSGVCFAIYMFGDHTQKNLFRLGVILLVVGVANMMRARVGRAAPPS